MEPCKKCGKLVEKEEKTYNDLCFKCYKAYLFEKIENHKKQRNKPTVIPEKFSKRLIKFIKNLFKKKGM